MVLQIEMSLDVTDAVGLGSPANVAVTVVLPEPEHLREDSVVCFAKPGGGYSKGYYTTELPGPGRGAQAQWHVSRGWIFVAVDHLGVGQSTIDLDPTKMDYTTLAAASQSAERQILDQLGEGQLAPGIPAITNPVKIGIGQSMGGCMTIVQQGRYHCYDGIGVLGYSAVHTHPPTRPGRPSIAAPWLPRDTLVSRDPLMVLNGPQLEGASNRTLSEQAEVEVEGLEMAWGFFYDDVPEEVIVKDLTDFPVRGGGDLSPWASGTLPLAVAASCLTPGIVASEAAAVMAPVLVAFGERDVCADVKGEPRAYLSAQSIDLFVCPRMGHMHNFAGTRDLFWERIHAWGEWCRVAKLSGRS